ncbi:MAG: hypothetical protein KIT36_02410 [Alphaproteobacteria bacterium]|nr:hypothetical protein [Alphaproteobacteria bacterium]
MALLLAVAPAWAQTRAGESTREPPPDPGGLSAPAVSACINKVDLDRGNRNSTYRAVAFDGQPWLGLRTLDKKLGTQRVWSRIAGTGMWWQADGTTVALRFACQLDSGGRAVKVQTEPVNMASGDRLPPHRLISGTARIAGEVPADGELRLQLLDASMPRTPKVIAEQVVRGGQAGVIPFALRLPADTALDGRPLTIEAIIAAQGLVRAALRTPRPVSEADVAAPVTLLLE